MLNKGMLRSKMALHHDDQNALAAYLGISVPRLSAKMNAKKVTEKTKAAQFTQDEIYKIMKRYELTPDEVVQIFLADEVNTFVHYMNQNTPTE